MHQATGVEQVRNAGGATWRHCLDCDLAWESKDEKCWDCGKRIFPTYTARPNITSQAAPVAAMRDWECENRDLPL